MSRNRILIVDSDAQCVNKITRTLSAVGYPFEVASNEKMATNMAGPGQFGIALVADRLGDSNGFDCLARLRRLDRSVVGVVLTEQPDLTAVVSAVDYGALHVLPKPVDANDLMEMLSRVGRRQSADVMVSNQAAAKQAIAN